MNPETRVQLNVRISRDLMQRIDRLAAQHGSKAAALQAAFDALEARADPPPLERIKAAVRELEAGPTIPLVRLADVTKPAPAPRQSDASTTPAPPPAPPSTPAKPSLAEQLAMRKARPPADETP